MDNTAPAQLITAPAQLITAPAQPPATGAVVYTALFYILDHSAFNVWLMTQTHWTSFAESVAPFQTRASGNLAITNLSTFSVFKIVK